MFQLNLEKERQLDLRLYRRKQELPDCAVEFLRSIEFNKALQTQVEYAKDIHLFFEYLSKEIHNNKPIQSYTISDLANITEEDALGFFDYLSHFEREFTTVGGNRTVQTFSNGPKGKERKRASLKMFYDYFILREKLQKNPMQFIQIKSKKDQVKPRLKYSEIDLMLEAAIKTNPDEYRGFRNYIIIKILSYTGIRISELTDINISDVWDSRNEMVVTRKGGEQEIIYINENIRTDFYRYLKLRKKIENVKKEHKEALFLSQQMRRIDPKSIRKMLRVVASKANVSINVTPHTFRRTFGWKHYNDNKDLELTATILGHENSETTRRSYARADEKRSRDSLDSFEY